MKHLLLGLWLLPRNAAIAMMRGYRAAISPLYGPVCRYHPSCSRYSLEAYQERGFLVGLALTIWRLLRCNPFSSGGIDDVPARTNPLFSTNQHGFVIAVDRKAS
ncbi:membrane protein insertion efficiency factor YidD [Leucobacter sp. M11]|uniref:membrane protein insertion efficiency factor YidD n=1 Tax=Leucobacter sp. M11 TaxID=2993565 RepID=UPI002D800925|nr:membrane protein insertion efficiency factor YidD [Leucobacter sp. M11]MEB4614889.1 membrane protein insertion efficiency factor YidD [Leucobacter sp. M11]